MAEKLLRGKQPLTMYRGSTGTNGGYLYRGGVIDAAQVDAKDADRLVGEGFLEWVVRQGEQFVLAEDTATGKAGDVVTTGDTGTVPDSEVPDLGTFNSGGQIKLEEQQEAAEKAKADADRAKADSELEEKRAAARQKLSEMGGTPDGRSSQAVWVEFMVGEGSAYDDVKDATKAELVALHEQRSKS